MTLKRAIEVLQATDGAESIEMTQETKEAIEMAVDVLIHFDVQLEGDPNVFDGAPKKRRITFGELLDLIDDSRKGNDAIELMGHDGKADITGRVSSAYFVTLEDRVVNGFGAFDDAVQVWLED